MDILANKNSEPIRPNTVGVFVLDNFALMSYAATVEPMRAANDLAGRILFDIRYFTYGNTLINSSGHAQLQSSDDIEQAEGFDYLFVVAGGSSEDLFSLPIISLLKNLAVKNNILVGVSGGPLLLARAGLMKNRRMTVHWEHAEMMKRLIPELMLEKSLYVIDRDRITCAGGIAPLDMMYQMISKMYGASFARNVSDWFLHTQIRPSESAQQASLAVQYDVYNRAVLESIELMRAHVADPLTRNDLAYFTHLSSRQLGRLFQQHIGVSVMAFYLDLRLNHAKELLKNSHLSKTEIALATGFSSSAHFATSFRKKFGVSPSAAFFARKN